jgi:hypothetical protein
MLFNDLSVAGVDLSAVIAFGTVLVWMAIAFFGQPNTQGR